MAATTFHRFPDLPTELRLHIWELAGCAMARPRIHFLPIESSRQETFGRRLIPDGLDLRGLDSKVPGYCCSVEVMPRAERSWVKDNESDYLIDAGMWTACKESAWVLMKKRLSRARPYNIRFGTFRDGSDDWVFDVDVSRDLFCFQFSNNAYWSLHTEWELLPFWNTSRRDGFVSVAVEFDSSWSVGIEPDMVVGTLERMVNEPGARGFFLSLIKKEMNGESYVPQIYLIDRSIRRSQYERPSSYSEFHSMGRAFGFVVGEYTVVEDDLTPEMEPEMDAFDFLRAIDSVGDYWKALGLSYDRSYEDGELVEFRTWSRTSVKAYVSVLAQEEEDDMESPGKEYEGTEVWSKECRRGEES